MPLMHELGMDASWEVIEGNEDFFACTKSFHNALQGKTFVIPEGCCASTKRSTRERRAPPPRPRDCGRRLHPRSAAGAPSAATAGTRRGKWIWRCHIDLSHPYRPVWKYLRQFIDGYDASMFSLDAFAQPMPHPVFLIPPSIDPLEREERASAHAEKSRRC